MFKKLSILVFVFTCIFSIQAQEKSDREKSGLIGYVKSVREETAEIIFKKGKPTERKSEFNWVETYDISGKQISYSFGKSKDETETIIYDEKGRVKEIIKKKQPFLNLIPRKVRSYDENDRLIEEKGFDEDGTLLGRRTYRYDSQGNLVEETSEGEKNFYNDYTRKYKYNRNNHKIEEATYKKVNGEWMPEDFRVGFYKKTFFYNADGKKIAENQISSDEKVHQTSIFTFDEKDRELETNVFNADGTVKSRTRYSYDTFDKQGNVTKETEYEWVFEDGKSFFKPSEAIYYKIDYFSEKEIKEFEAKNKNPNKPQENKALQNTDKEEYEVYYAILEQWIVNKEVKNIVVRRFTRSHNSGDEKPLNINSFASMPNQKSPLEKAMVDDYNEKNYRRNSQISENMFGEKSKIVLVSDSEFNEYFAEDCDEGWQKLRGKYPESQGLTTLSRVGFNEDKTKAVVYLGHSFACLGGAGHLIFLQKQFDGWKIVETSMLWIS